VKPELGAAWAWIATPVLAAVVVLAGVGGAIADLWSWWLGVAAAPSSLLVVVALWLRTHPRRLKRVGWSLVGANLVTLSLLLVA
jgi:hypothetical protein